MRSFIALLLLSFIAIAICQTSPVAAPSNVGNGRVRTLRFFKSPGTVGVKAVAATKVGGLTELDAILAGATLLPFPTMALSYFTAEREVSEDMTTFASGRFSFAFRFVGIIEYDESGATEGFQYDEDAVVSYYSFGQELAAWEGSTSSEVNNNGQTVRVATAATKDGVVSFTLVFSGDRTVFENKTLNGDNFKFSVAINYGNAPAYSGRNDTSIAVVTLTGSKKAVREVDFSGQLSDGFEVLSDDEAIAGQLSWDRQVTATNGDGQATVNLVNTVDSTLRNDTAALNITTGWTTRVVYHAISLEEGMSIGNTELYWDPELGADIDYEALNSSSSSIIASIAVVVSAIVAFLV